MNYPVSFIDYCDALTLKLTALRKSVLYILWLAKKPIKAYEILNELLTMKPNATPPTVYRALDFFVAQGVLHKIESIQSYTLCCEPAKQLPSEILMVCNSCHQVIELYDMLACTVLTKISTEQSFRLNHDVIELKGTCYSCL
ncbi:MAG: Fur family transcriptional regulator [Legionellaceae bacterium]|nr:Fur family transcriptional regulator [Legionellaceae bacterium]